MTKRTVSIEAPTTFNRETTPEQVLPYDMELLTPMVGGGIKSWEPDFKNPIRSQSIKGHLRFWWRTMQHCKDPTTLREREDALWGSTAKASTVRLAVIPYGTPERKILSRDARGYVQYEDLPPYVLFPLQGQKEKDQFTIITDLKFHLTINCRKEDREAVKNTVKLWVLFGGIGARTRRGCGSITCQQIEEEFLTPEAIIQFIRKFQKEGGPAFIKAPYPHLQSCRFAWQLQQGKGDPKAVWKSFLDRYQLFRQGENYAREPRKKGDKHPGHTRWPEADAIRLLTDKRPGLHGPVHPAGIWFPRAAYGLPILTKFKKQQGEPAGDYVLQPKGRDRWPSPMILKVIKLGNREILQTCLILNQAMPDQLTFTGSDIDGHTLLPSEMPLASKDKTMPANAPLETNTSPYDAIIDFFKLREA